MKLVCVAIITGAHGVHGAVKVKSFTHNPADMETYKIVRNEEGRAFKIKNFKIHKNDIAIIKFYDINDRNMAEELTKTKLFVERDILPDLEEEEFYHADLVHLKVMADDEKTQLATIKAVHNFGAGDLLEIELLKDKKTLIIPFTKETVSVMRIEEGYVVLGIEGMAQVNEAME
jgi:16S rRNA processing protein RimM